MPILSVRNSLVPPIVAMRALSYWDPEEPIMANADINAIMGSESYLYLTNRMDFVLRPTDTEVTYDSFRTEIETNFTHFQTYWKRRPPHTPLVREWENWQNINIGYRRTGSGIPLNSARISSLSPTRLSIEVSRYAITNIEDLADPPVLPDSLDLEFGILVLPIKFVSAEGDEFERYYGIKITTNEVFSVVGDIADEVTVINIEPEYTTPHYAFESLHIPDLKCSLVYNFWEPQEENYEIIKERDYEGTYVRDIPKYIELSWTPSPQYLQPVIVTPTGADGTGPGPSVSLRESPRSEEPRPAPTTPPAIPTYGDEATEERTRAGAGGTVFFGGIVFSPELTSELSDAGAEDAEAAYGSSLPTPSVGNVLSALRGEDREGETSSSPFLPTFDADLPEDAITTRPDRDITMPPIPEFVYPWLNSGYVGYSILKERYDSLEDKFYPVDVAIVNSRRTTSWRDWKIAYGESYRYSVRSVFRFINKYNLPMYKDSDAIIDNNDQFSRFESGISMGHAESYYYDGKKSDPCEVPVVDTTSPDSPFNLQIFPCSKKKEIFLTWNQKNQNRDVIGFNVYRKNPENKFFKKLNFELIDTRDNFWVDVSIELEQRYVYAIEAIDVHDNYSLLSAQYSAMIIPQNIDITQRKCEASVIFEKWPGERFGETFIQDIQIRQDHLLFVDGEICVKVNPLFNNLEREDPFILRVTSLDTYEKKEISLKFQVNAIYHSNPLRAHPGHEDSLEVGTSARAVEQARRAREGLPSLPDIGSRGRFGL